MARRKIIAGNWKMNMTPSEAVELINTLKPLVATEDADVVFCVPAIDIIPALEAAKGSNIEIGAENMYFEEKGAYTGEISPAMLTDVGVKYVIIGHSERREYFAETDETVNKKVLKALSADLVPILCFGESWEEREAGKTIAVVERQLTEALQGVKVEDLTSIIFAYEPIWAISAGKDAKPRNATSDQAEEAIAKIKEIICKIFNLKSADMIVVLYGGSMNDKNCVELLSKPSIDGGLIGGACLDIAKFSTVFQTRI